jgi:hypothetical protein
MCRSCHSNRESVYKLCTASARIRGADAPVAPEVGSVDGVPRKGDHEKAKAAIEMARARLFIPALP